MNPSSSTIVLGNVVPAGRRRKPAVVTALAAGFRLRPRSRRNMLPTGLGLVEVICSTLIIGIVLVASLETVGAVFRTQRLNADRLTGPNLAMELMTEILSMPYEDPEFDETEIGTDMDEEAITRNDFDDIDDYDGWNNLGVEAKDGTPRVDFSEWRQQVNVAWVDDENTDLKLKRITLTITSPDGDETQLTAYRGKGGALEQSLGIEGTAIAWLEGTLQLGTGNSTATVGTNLTNHATDAE